MKIAIKVKPNSGRSGIEKVDDGSFIVQLKSAPVDGRANQELVRLLAKHFHVPQKAIIIKQGSSGKKKLIKIIE